MAVRHKALFLIKSYLLAMEKNEQKKVSGILLRGCGTVERLGPHEKQECWCWDYLKVEYCIPWWGCITPPRQTRQRKAKQRACSNLWVLSKGKRKMFLEIARENTDQLTTYLMEEQFASSILLVLEKDSRDNECFDDGSPSQKLLVKLLTNPPQ